MDTAARVAAKSLGLPVADLQAVLWYYEKALYESMGQKPTRQSYVHGIKGVVTEADPSLSLLRTLKASHPAAFQSANAITSPAGTRPQNRGRNRGPLNEKVDMFTPEQLQRALSKVKKARNLQDQYTSRELSSGRYHTPARKAHEPPGGIGKQPITNRASSPGPTKEEPTGGYGQVQLGNYGQSKKTPEEVEQALNTSDRRQPTPPKKMSHCGEGSTEAKIEAFKKAHENSNTTPPCPTGNDEETTEPQEDQQGYPGHDPRYRSQEAKGFDHGSVAESIARMTAPKVKKAAAVMVSPNTSQMGFPRLYRP